jgi:CheY-like chemotaxis protein
MSLIQDIAPTPPAPVKTIMVVEDDPDTGEVIRLVLVDETPYSILHVATASEALRVASTTHADLFIIDYLLAEMDGITLYDQLRTIPGLSEVPVLIISANLKSHEQELHARELVGVGKPFDLDAFIETVKKIITS